MFQLSLGFRGVSGGIGRQKYRTGTRIFTYLFRVLSQELDKDEHGPHVI